MVFAMSNQRRLSGGGPPASGFLEGINAFEETACWRAECQAKSGESSELKGVHRGNRSFTPVADSAFAEDAFSG